jgi:hypothetical protein
MIKSRICDQGPVYDQGVKERPLCDQVSDRERLRWFSKLQLPSVSKIPWLRPLNKVQLAIKGQNVRRIY